MSTLLSRRPQPLTDQQPEQTPIMPITELVVVLVAPTRGGELAPVVQGKRADGGLPGTPGKVCYAQCDSVPARAQICD